MEEGFKQLQNGGLVILSKKEMEMLGMGNEAEKRRQQKLIVEKLRQNFNLPCLRKEALNISIKEMRKELDKGILRLYNQKIEDIKAYALKNAPKIVAVDKD